MFQSRSKNQNDYVVHKLNKLEVDVARIKMTVAEDRKVFREVKTGFDEMKHAIMKFITSHTGYASYTYIKIHFLFNIFTPHSNTYIFGLHI